MAAGRPMRTDPYFSEHSSVLGIIMRGGQPGWEACELGINSRRSQSGPSITNLSSYFLIRKTVKQISTPPCREE